MDGCYLHSAFPPRPLLMSFCLISDHVPGVPGGNSLKLDEMFLAPSLSSVRRRLRCVGYKTERKIQLQMLAHKTVKSHRGLL